ncbi:MAG: ABC transporter permease [Bacteroidota bacterium]
MKNKITGIFSVLRRELGIITRDKDLITLILLSPLFYAFFYGSIYLNKSENSVPVAVVDMDKSITSQSLIRSLDSHQLIDISRKVNDYSSAVDLLYKMDVQGIVYIPKGFSADLKSGMGTDLKVYLNTSRFLVSNDINKAITEVALTYSAAVKLKYFQAQGYSFEQAKEIAEPIHTEIHSLFNPTESYGDFMIPGILVLVLQQTLLIGLAESIAKERETGSLKSLYSASNRSVWALITGKGAFYFLLYCAYAFMFYTVHFSLFKLNFIGSYTAAAVLTVLFLIAVIYLCIFVSSFFKRKIVSMQVFAFTSYPFFLISGYPWPFQEIPAPLQLLSWILPSTPYLNAFSRITMMGAGWNDVLPEFYHLLILCFIGLICTRMRMRALLRSETGENIHSVWTRLTEKA